MLRGYLGDITSLKVRKATRDRLGKLGNKTETYDDVLNRLIDFYLSSGTKKRHSRSKLRRMEGRKKHD
jgi:hypothetical protein